MHGDRKENTKDRKRKRAIWRKKKIDISLARKLAQDIGIPEILGRLLVSRGIDTPLKAEKFLNPSLTDAESPFIFPDMKKAAERLASAIMKNEVIGIFSDADADGISAAAVITNFLLDLGLPRKNIAVRVPSRDKEGYGLTKEFVDEVRRAGGKLIITADCGVRNHEEIRYAKLTGSDIIVCDHHHTDYSLPESAFAILHTATIKEETSAKFLSGTGVAFELVAATAQELRKTGKDISRPRKYLDIVSVGTVGDMVPLLGDNRIFVKYGLDLIRGTGGNIGLEALIRKTRTKKENISSWDLSMRIVPRINSSGRIGRPQISYELLTESDIKKLEMISDEIEKLNSQRKDAVNSILEDIYLWSWDETSRFSLVFWGEDWPEGVIGLVASKLLEETGKPTCVISIRKNEARGSLRAPEFINIMGVLSRLSHLLLKYGGHAQAAGISLLPEKIGEFARDFENEVRNILNHSFPQIVIEYDDEIELERISLDELRKIALLEPFGEGNPYPVFSIECEIFESKVVGKEENHLKLIAKTKDGFAEIIAFSMADKIEEMYGRRKIIARFKPSAWSNEGFEFEFIDFEK